MDFCAIAPDMLKFYNYEFQYISEPDDFDLRIGSNSRDVQKVSLKNKQFILFVKNEMYEELFWTINQFTMYVVFRYSGCSESNRFSPF